MKVIDQINKAFPYLLGKKVTILAGETMYKMTGTVVAWSGMYLTLEGVMFASGIKKDTDTIHAQWIRKINVVN